MSRVFRLAALALLSGSIAACVQVYPQQQPTPVAATPSQEKKDDKDKAPFKKWDDVLKDTRAIEGYFTFHRKRDNTLYLELRPDQLGQDFGLVMHFSRGVGDFNLHDGLPLSDTRLMRFRREGDKIYLVHRNPRFTAAEGSPMRVSLNENVGHSIAAAFKIESEQKETKNVLIDVTSFFVSDYADLADWIKTYYGNKPVSFDKDRSYLGSVMGFPKNVEIDAELTFKASDYPRSGGEGVSDYRSVPVGVRY
jgi:predicted small lipoprotein YifL